MILFRFITQNYLFIITCFNRNNSHFQQLQANDVEPQCRFILFLVSFFFLNLTIYMIIYKRNIHVWRSMKHFQNANLQKGLQKLTFKYNDKLEYVFYTGVRCYDSRAVGFLTWPLIHLNQWRWHREIQYWGDQVVIQYQHKMAATLSFDCQPVFPFSPKKNWNNINGDLKLLVFEQYMLISLKKKTHLKRIKFQHMTTFNKSTLELSNKKSIIKIQF